MAEQKFVKSDALKFGWETVKADLKFFIAFTLLAMAVYIVLNLMSEAVSGSAVLALLVGIFGFCVQRLVETGFITTALKHVDGQKGEYKDMIAAMPVLLNYILGSILYALMVLVGTILLIVPGIYLGITFMFFGYFIVEQKMGPIEALKASARITNGSRWNLFLFGLLIMLVNIAGLIALVVGLLVTVPLSSVAVASVYRKLLSETAETPAA